MQLDDFKYLMDGCKRLMASKVHAIQFFTDACIEALDKYNNTILLLRSLSGFLSTWSNHSILRMLVSFNNKAVMLLDEFDSLLNPLYTIVSYPIPNFSQDMIPPETSEYTVLGIRSNRELWQCSLQDVLNVQSFIVEKCDISQCCLQLLAVKNNPTVFYWTIPKCIVELIKANLLLYGEFLYSQGILEVLVHHQQSFTTGDDIRTGSLALMGINKQVCTLYCKIVFVMTELSVHMCRKINLLTYLLIGYYSI